jgi:endonuclease IV
LKEPTPGNLEVVREHARCAKQISAEGIVVHLPKQPPKVVAEVLKAMGPTECPIFLENHAYKADDCSYELPEKLNALSAELDRLPFQTWYCIDTAHLWSNITGHARTMGYCVEKESGFYKWLNELSPSSIKRIRWFHLNGSQNPASSNNDHHASLTGPSDKMWSKDNLGSLPYIIKFAQLNHIGLILENNDEEQRYTVESLKVIAHILTSK